MPSLTVRFAMIWIECRHHSKDIWNHPGRIRSLWNAFEASVLHPDRYFDVKE